MLVWILAIFFICWSPLETMLLFMEYAEQVILILGLNFYLDKNNYLINKIKVSFMVV